MNEIYLSDDDKLIYDGEYYQLVSRDFYYSLHKRGDRYDDYIIVRECSRSEAMRIAKAMDCYVG